MLNTEFLHSVRWVEDHEFGGNYKICREGVETKVEVISRNNMERGWTTTNIFRIKIYSAIIQLDAYEYGMQDCVQTNPQLRWGQKNKGIYDEEKEADNLRKMGMRYE
jgi:hypothetical protein